MVATDKYDNRDQLWRFSESFVLNYYNVPCSWSTSEVHYDLQAGRYVFYYLDNEEEHTYNFDVDIPRKNFSVGALRRSGRR